jgi:nicotinamidase-related amidase
MPKKEKYFTTENLDDEVKGILDEIRISGGRERGFQISGNPALIVTDMQEYFLSPDSHAFIPSAEAIIPNIRLLINHFQEKDHPIIFTQHNNTKEDAGNMKTWWRDLISSSPLLPFSSSNKTILQKSQYDAFFNTNLEDILVKKNIGTLIICGVMTNLCCETTLRSAFVRGYNAILPLDATATYKRIYHTSTFVNLSFGFCPVMTTGEILSTLKND